MITVIGSINMDLVTSMKEIPKIGETVMGNTFMQNTGGKGANQAVAAAKLGSEVAFIGKVGDDIFGQSLKEALKVNGVNTSHLRTKTGCSSGMAIIQVDEAGRNNIVVVPGSNYAITREDIDQSMDLLSCSAIVIMQMEIPSDIVQYTLEKSKQVGCVTILNPAPACELSDSLLKNVDILIPNEHELQRITKVDCRTLDGIKAAGKKLLQCGVSKVIVTMGEKGVFYFDKAHNELYPANKVNVVDTTAAGDAFVGGFASHYEKNRDFAAAINYGQKVSAFAIQRAGALQSLPSAQDIEIS